MAKRLFDLLGAALALLLLWPLLLGAALCIKIDSPGPVLFRQQRVGRHGVPFRIHKFRTMRAQVERPAQGQAAAAASGSLLTVGEDPRITRVGAFLRRTRIDELPQLFDVLRGVMSLVGPRPEVPRYVAHYPAELRDRALAVRPGMTDPASLQFIDEAALLAAAADPEREYVEVILPAKVARAAAYADQATLASDLQVLWATARLLMARLRANPP